MSDTDNGAFAPTAWTPARTILWNALQGDDRKEFESWVTKGSDAPVPEKWKELHIQLRGVKRESVVPIWIVEHMRKIGRTDAVIDAMYAKFYR